MIGTSLVKLSHRRASGHIVHFDTDNLFRDELVSQITSNNHEFGYIVNKGYRLNCVE